MARLIVSPRPPEAPTFWIIAGANGSGKSSAYDRMSIDAPEGSVWIINPDLLTARIHGQELLPQNDANLQAVRRIEKWLRASIMAHQSVGVETVLSTPKYRKLVRLAKRRGFRVRLIYVTLKSAELNIERVAVRVAKGGHHVPDEKIIDRRRRSFQELPWFLAHADQAEILDNSGAEPRLVANKTGNTIAVAENIPLELDQAIDRVVSGDLRPSAQLQA